MNEQNTNKNQDLKGETHFHERSIAERLDNGFKLLEQEEQPCFTSAYFETPGCLRGIDFAESISR